MKNTVTMVVFMITFIGMYFVLSLIGIAFGCDYKETIQNMNWFVIYSLFFGSWIASIPARDVYELMKEREQ